MPAQQTISSFLYDCLAKEGITEIFGVPGDYNFALLDELESYSGIRFVDNRNELNAGYAADGYAHVAGLSAMITTFGVGELSASNAVAGAYSEHIPLIHIVGSPAFSMQEAGTKAHHTLMNGDYSVFLRMHQEITCYAVKITPENAAEEIPKAIASAVRERKPVYLDIPQDTATTRIETPGIQQELSYMSDELVVQETAQLMKEAIDQAEKAVLLVDIFTSRYHMENIILQLAEHLNIPTAQMMQGKSGFNEQHPLYIGIYAGAFGSQQVRDYVENADLIITAGLLESDFNMAKFTADLPAEKRIDIQPQEISIQNKARYNTVVEEVIDALTLMECRTFEQIGYLPSFYDFPSENYSERLLAETYYPIIQKLLQPKDIVVVETGTFSYGLPHVRLPENTLFISQGSWQSIGYALPAAFGAELAAPGRRVLLFMGDGSFQLTAQELSAMAEQNLKPVIFFLNNKGYTVERYLNTENTHARYNDIPHWDYMQLVKSFYPAAETVSVSTSTEFEEAVARIGQNDTLHFIEMNVDDQMDAPIHLKRLREFAEGSSS
ncbi:thiamine pyrophosphate-binding protein [Marinococcus halophilus]|uniref:Alpha-keto-acid decarboxylase n=1 Tax=Marinococcus halophilus TaxID=1371 RepID=A0A510Y1E7_MARHA|nr:thiamine pyrophosphate-binding protein [Marinococcus halophilus]OZT81169.1 thiamine pyrophosphate-binding protein [Marinococcus halophilus]GEK57099.1 indolepyruvate decarboxylase [Marinococcus halophilus]